MSAVLRASLRRTAARARADSAWGSSTVVHHVLDGLASFHASEVEALVTVQQLASPHGVRPDQMVLLRPTDAGWPRFVQLSRQWNRRPHGQGGASIRRVGLSMLLTALVAALLTAALLRQDELISFEVELLAIGAAALFGALAAASLAMLLLGQQPQFKAFDRTVRHQLGKGRWVVLVHDLPWARQAGVVDLISRRSSNWCAVSSSRQSL